MTWKTRVRTVLVSTALLAGLAVGVGAPAASAAAACNSKTTSTTTVPARSSGCYVKKWRCTKTKWTWKGRKCVSGHYVYVRI